MNHSKQKRFTIIAVAIVIFLSILIIGLGFIGSLGPSFGVDFLNFKPAPHIDTETSKVQQEVESIRRAVNSQDYVVSEVRVGNDVDCRAGINQLTGKVYRNIDFTVSFTPGSEEQLVRIIETALGPMRADDLSDTRSTRRIEMKGATYDLVFTVPQAGNIATFTGTTACSHH